MIYLRETRTWSIFRHSLVLKTSPLPSCCRSPRSETISSSVNWNVREMYLCLKWLGHSGIFVWTKMGTDGRVPTYKLVRDPPSKTRGQVGITARPCGFLPQAPRWGITSWGKPTRVANCYFLCESCLEVAKVRRSVSSL